MEALKQGADALFILLGAIMVLTFAAAIPAIISGGIAERAKFWPQLIAEEEYEGADLTIHRIGSTPDREVNW